jgi:hypothetical protein
VVDHGTSVATPSAYACVFLRRRSHQQQALHMRLLSGASLLHGHSGRPGVDVGTSRLRGDTVRVISGDRGIRVRGTSRGIPVQALSSHWRLPLTQGTDAGGTSGPRQASTSR